VYPKKGWPLSEAELSFAESLVSDLGPLGYSLTREGEVLTFQQRVPASIREYRTFYRAAHAKVHANLLRPNIEEIVAFENDIGADIFIDGTALDLGRIEPILRPVNLHAPDTSPRDKAIVEYIRAYQTVTSRKAVGKENVYILEDRGQLKSTVMGVLVLTSPRYYQARRDEVLGWLSPSRIRSLSERQQARQKRVRLAGLDRMMHLSICCALPPYSQLGTARLLAVAPFTKIVREDFARRWARKDSDLAIVTTTTSMGITGVPFQALRRGKFVDQENAELLGDNWNKAGKLYARLGDVHPWKASTPIKSSEIFANFGKLISAETYAKASLLLSTDGSSSLSPNKVLDRALNELGLSGRGLRGNPLGVFIGALDRQSIEAVASGKPRTKRPVLNWDLAVQQFRSDYGEASDPTKKPGVNKDERAAAIKRRRERAVNVRREDILLSRRFLAELKGDVTDEED